MSDEPSGRLTASPAPPAPDEYDAICAVLMHTERGRWFLQEYARRSRSADTEVLLTAIKRIESVVRTERTGRVPQSFRSDLIEMAQAIARTRAEVAGIKPSAMAASAPPPRAGAAPPSREPAAAGDVFATAERIRDVTWAMRGQGFDPSTCDQLEELAGSILSASSLRDPADRRARKLGEVLHDLERRVSAMLESCAESDADRNPGEPASGRDPPQWSAWPSAELAPSASASEVLRLPPQPSVSLLAGPQCHLPGNTTEPGGQPQAAPDPAALKAPAPAEAAPAGAANDPLAPIKAMSEVERIALFT
jgi:hypothetical protein